MSADWSIGFVISTALVSVVSGYLAGLYAARGYALISPELAAERRAALHDPVESDESDIEEGDTVLDHAPNWSNAPDADLRQGLRQRFPIVDSGEECKLVLVVRTDLGMTKGKIAAQCGHATLACYKAMAAAKAGSTQRAILARWERMGQMKIALQVKNEEELVQLKRKARGMGLTAETIADAGRTQIAAGSLTVLGVGPAPKSQVDAVTSHLKLLYG